MRLFVALAFLASFGCGKDDKAPPPPAPAARPEPESVAPAKPVKLDLGTCVVNVSGALTVSETTPGGRSAVASKYWQSDDERGTSPVQELTINCIGKDVRFSVVSKPGASVPFGPKTYRLDKRGDLVVLARAGKPLTDVSGTVEVTAFDGRHVAGSIEASGKQTGGGNVKLSGTFDFACPGYGGCSRN